MPTKLPAQLAYLSATIAQLEKFEPDSLGDDNPEAWDLVELALRRRVHGMGESQARAAVKEDCAALKQWLKQSGHENSAAHYVYGAMEGMIMWGDFGDLSR